MLPNKLTHGDNLASLFEKFNTVIDYLREIRLVAGPGIRINRLSAGTTIEATATASGGTPSAPQGHPFDAQIINKGTGDEPDYYVRIYNSSLPDSPVAGFVYVGDWNLEVPVTELAVNTQNGFFIDLTVSCTGNENSPFTTALSLRQYGTSVSSDDTTYVVNIAEGKLPNIASRTDSDIAVYGRYL